MNLGKDLVFVVLSTLAVWLILCHVLNHFMVDSFLCSFSHRCPSSSHSSTRAARRRRTADWVGWSGEPGSADCDWRRFSTSGRWCC